MQTAPNHNSSSQAILRNIPNQSMRNPTIPRSNWTPSHRMASYRVAILYQRSPLEAPKLTGAALRVETQVNSVGNMGMPGTILLRTDLLSDKDPTAPQTIAPEAPETTIFRRSFETALDLEGEKYTARMTPTSVAQMYLPRRIDGHQIECSRTSASQAAAGLPRPEDRPFPMPLLAWIP